MSPEESLVRLWEASRKDFLKVIITPAETDPDKQLDAIHINPGGPGNNNPHKLFSHVPSLEGDPLFGAFRELASLYEIRRGHSEVEKDKEDRKAEEKVREDFAELLLRSPSMKFAFDELKAALYVQNWDEFVKGVKWGWFSFYDRGIGNTPESSGLEHTFLGDLTESGTRLSGFHFWYQFHLKEEAPTPDADFLKHRGTTQVNGSLRDPTPEMVYVDLEYTEATKEHGSSMFVGTTFDFEMALYTMVYFMNKKAVTAKFGEYKVTVKVSSNSKGQIQSAFPKIISWKQE